MSVSPCSGSSSTSAVQPQAPSSRNKSTEAPQSQQPEDTVHLSAQALQQLQGMDADGDGDGH